MNGRNVPCEAVKTRTSTYEFCFFVQFYYTHTCGVGYDVLVTRCSCPILAPISDDEMSGIFFFVFGLQHTTQRGPKRPCRVFVGSSDVGGMIRLNLYCAPLFDHIKVQSSLNLATEADLSKFKSMLLMLAASEV